MKDLGEASYVLSIPIIRDRPSGILRLSQRKYIERILKRFNIQLCSYNDIERDQMTAVSYSSVVDNLMYAQVCTRPDIAFVVSVLGRYLSDPGQSHWKVTKKVLRYLQGTKDLMLTYRHTDTLEVVCFSDFDYAGCVKDKKSTFGYIFMMAEGVVLWKSVKQTLTTSSIMEADMWRVMRLLVMQYDCGTSFQFWRLFTPFLDS